MLEEYYSRLALIRSKPEILNNKSDEDNNKVKSALVKVYENLESSDENLELAMKEFVDIFDDLGLYDESEADKTRRKHIEDKLKKKKKKKISMSSIF